MLKRFVLAFVVLALAVASAATYKVTIRQSSAVNGNELKAGDYRLNVQNDKVTMVNGKQSVEVPVKVENVEQKYDTTTIRYSNEGGKFTISEIRLGGTKTKLVFTP
jgi:hypothetical protein